MGKTNKQEICAPYKIILNKPCRTKINTGQIYTVEFNPGSTLEVSYKNLSTTNSALVTTTIGNQELSQVPLEAGERQTKRYPITEIFSYISFTNEASCNDTFVEICVKQLPVVSPLKLHYGNPVKLYIPEKNGYIVSADFTYGGFDIKGRRQYFPRFSKSDTPIKLLLLGGSGVIKDGDTVKIETTETSVEEYKVLGAWITSTLYYYTGGYDKNQEWTIRKKNKNNSDLDIYYGDEVYFLNPYYEQWLCIEDSGTWLTRKKDANVYWLIDQP